MVYSKILRHSNRAISQRLSIFNNSSRSVKPCLLNSTLKLSNGSFTYINNCQYSTILSLKFNQQLKPVPKCTSPLNLAAFMSTSGGDDKYQIIITNPTEGTSSTLNSSLGSPINAVQNPEELFLPTSDIANATTSLTDELASVAELVEPALSSLGLASCWTPVGLVQMFLEYLHVSLQCPWWIAIVACTISARILLLPLLIKIQRNTIHMSNYMPQLQYLQSKFGEARRTGNSMEATKYANEMMMFMKDKNISPMKNAFLPIMQAPVFISFFLALRGMAKAPVESMKYGGISWVTDLTIPDPYYILPLLSCGTLYVVLKVGAESGIKMENLQMSKYILKALPVLALPFCINFPSAVLYYWVTTNFCTLAIVGVLKLKPVREYFKLPTQLPIDPKFVMPKKGFIKEVKNAFEDQKILAAVQDRRRVDNIRFQKSGTGPIPRTYSYDPSKPRPSNVASTANKNIIAKEHKV